jgi:hypothetical protein
MGHMRVDAGGGRGADELRSCYSHAAEMRGAAIQRNTAKRLWFLSFLGSEPGEKSTHLEAQAGERWVTTTE